MVTIYDTYDNQTTYEFTSTEDAIQWLCIRANQWNCGMARMWEENGFRYYDVGPRVYKIALEHLNEKIDS